MRIAIDRNVACEIIDRQPHSDQTRMAIECYRQLDVECLMYMYTWNTKIDEVNTVPQLASQISGPALTRRIIGAEAKGIRCTNGNIGQATLGWLLYHEMSFGCLSTEQGDTASQKKQNTNQQCRKKQS